MLAELLGALGRFEAKPRTDSRISTRSRATRIRIDEASSILVIHEPRKPLVLIPIREIGYKSIFLVPCFGYGEELVECGDCFEVVWVDVFEQDVVALLVFGIKRYYIVGNMECVSRLEVQIIASVIKGIDCFCDVDFCGFEGEVEWCEAFFFGLSVFDIDVGNHVVHCSYCFCLGVIDSDGGGGCVVFVSVIFFGVSGVPSWRRVYHSSSS